MARLFNKSQMPDDETMETYAFMLESYEINQITMAFTSLLDQGIEFFPSCSRILKELNPRISNESKAQVMADNIFQVVVGLGRYQQKRFKEELNEEEMRILEKFGALSILESTLKDQPIIKAQLRKSCFALLDTQSIEDKQVIMSRLENASTGLIPFHEALKIAQGQK